MTHWKDDRIGSAERGENPTVLTRMHTGWAVIGDTQYLPGYCLLLYAGEANHLTDLPRDERTQFLHDLSLLGEAVEEVCRKHDPEGFRRLNYEVLGNSWDHLHGHIHPRYHWESEEFRHGSVWRYGPQRLASGCALGPRHDMLRNAIIRALASILDETPAP
ncbi:HIT family protein [Streptomyces sp. V4I2]|uniref:HIT family protein n=1 Tax=Streptomyces sp. V4I2 TaxID=3042280 RepID=UPI002780A355|nr:HIT domain-containing protein [Streptomyces sp. V4I2]MDQ1052001.1 diadenosine tetraphosphate (Ap4A) HIT family hydrolase [Streptomyces sp. V4I2]